MNPGALAFMIGAWVVVLGLMFWSFSRLLRADPSKEHPPPPGSIP
jgi:hypothetical protein